MREYDSYFFDLFHTLVCLEPHPEPGERECAILGISAREWSRAAEFDYGRRAQGAISDPDLIVERIVRSVCPDADARIVARVTATRKQRFRKALMEPAPETLRTLLKLRERGKRLVLVSNADALDALFWEESPLRRCFDAAVFSFRVGCMKPDPRIYRIAMERAGTLGSRSVFVGDGGHGELAGAKAVGMDAILMTGIIKQLWPEAIPELAKDADFCIEGLGALLEW